MKLTYGEVIKAKGALARLLKIKLPLKSGMQVAKLDIKLDAPMGEFYKIRDGLLEKHEVVFKPSANAITVKSTREEDKELDYSKSLPQNVSDFLKEFDELRNSETDELTLAKVKLPDIEIEPEILISLDKLLEG